MSLISLNHGLKIIPDDLSLLSGFKCYRRDRNDPLKTKGCGVAIFVCDHIKSEITIEIEVPDELEVYWVKTILPTYKYDIYVASVYFPPKCKLDSLLQYHLLTTIDNLRSPKPCL